MKTAVALITLATSLEAAVYSFEGVHILQKPQTCESYLGNAWDANANAFGEDISADFFGVDDETDIQCE